MGRTALYVNEYDTSRHGLIIERVDGWIDGLSAVERVSQLPGRVGAVILPPETETSPRTIQVSGVMKGTSLSNLRTLIEQLKARLYAGTVEARFVDHSDRFVLARCSQFSVPATAPQFMNPMTRVGFTLFCPDPLVYATQPTIVGFASAKGALPLGTAVSAPIIRIMGSATNPVLTYRDITGAVKQTMGFTVTLAATDYLEIDCELAQITRYISGVGSQNNAQALWTSGDFPVFDPQDGDVENGAYPTIEVSAGSGETAYRRSWI